MTKTNWVAVSVACVLAGLFAGGCASQKKQDGKAPLEPGVTDLGPSRASPASAVPPDPSYVSMPASATQPRFVPVDLPPQGISPATVSPSYASMSAEPPMMVSAAPASAMPPTLPPAATRTPAYATAMTPALTPPASGAGNRQYLVQKGDTLFSIAKVHYGNGNRWQHIATMNPGLTPTTLKAGTTIVVP